MPSMPAVIQSLPSDSCNASHHYTVITKCQSIFLSCHQYFWASRSYSFVRDPHETLLLLSQVGNKIPTILSHRISTSGQPSRSLTCIVTISTSSWSLKCFRAIVKVSSSTSGLLITWSTNPNNAFSFSENTSHDMLTDNKAAICSSDTPFCLAIDICCFHWYWQERRWAFCKQSSSRRCGDMEVSRNTAVPKLITWGSVDGECASIRKRLSGGSPWGRTLESL